MKIKNLVQTTSVLLATILICAAPSIGWGQAARVPFTVTRSSSDSTGNFLSNCKIHKDELERWVGSCDYGVEPYKAPQKTFVTSSPFTVEFNWVLKDDSGRILKDDKGRVTRDQMSTGYSVLVEAGMGQVRGELRAALFSYGGNAAFNTKSVTVDLILRDPLDGRKARVVLASQETALSINWPDRDTYNREIEVKTKEPSQVLDHATELVDTGRRRQIDAARSLLERLLVKEPKFAGAYVELARIAMKTNWGPEGLRQAETLISSSIQLQPGNLNALVLQGYVYAHQGRFKEAEAAFLGADKSELKNLWLWPNWGEMLVMQGKIDAAIPMYRKAIERPPTNDNYDRARIDAYENLLSILGSRKDIEGMEGLHRQRVKEYGVNTCYGADYALFKLMFRGDSVNAIALAEESIQAGCNKQEANKVLGYAFYTSWATSKDVNRNDLLNRARVYSPGGAGLLYGLSTSEQTLVAVTKLIALGESVDQLDNRKMNALAYALDSRDYDAATRLVRLGAKPEVAVGQQGMPVVLIPLLSQDYDGIRLLRKLGVDYSKIRFQGVTAIEMAKRIGDPKLVEALNAKASRV